MHRNLRHTMWYEGFANTIRHAFAHCNCTKISVAIKCFHGVSFKWNHCYWNTCTPSKDYHWIAVHVKRHLFTKNRDKGCFCPCTCKKQRNKQRKEELNLHVLLSLLWKSMWRLYNNLMHRHGRLKLSFNRK